MTNNPLSCLAKLHLKDTLSTSVLCGVPAALMICPVFFVTVSYTYPLCVFTPHASSLRHTEDFSKLRLPDWLGACGRPIEHSAYTLRKLCASLRFRIRLDDGGEGLLSESERNWLLSECTIAAEARIHFELRPSYEVGCSAISHWPQQKRD